jgi:hypothetical protein
MTHWVTHPARMTCINGHGYSHPKNSGMSLFFGDKGVLTLATACHQCHPATYAYGVIYSVRPIPLAFWYACPDKEAFTLVQKMDGDDVPLEDILKYLCEKAPRRVA